jgi:hypothetical protein
MAKKGFYRGIPALTVLVFGLLAAGCESMGDFVTGYSAGYTATSDEGLVYTFYNYSSHPVTISDNTGTQTISSGGQYSARFNRSANIYQVSYSPADSTSMEVSGTGVFFRDK